MTEDQEPAETQWRSVDFIFRPDDLGHIVIDLTAWDSDRMRGRFAWSLEPEQARDFFVKGLTTVLASHPEVGVGDLIETLDRLFPGRDKF